MAVPSIDDMVKTWKDRFSGSADKYVRRSQAAVAAGVDPIARARAPEAKSRARANYSAAMQDGGKFDQSMTGLTAQDWLAGVTKRGAQHLADGADKGQARYRKAMTKWQPILAQVSAEVHAMPKGGKGNAKARANRAIDILMDAAGRS